MQWSKQLWCTFVIFSAPIVVHAQTRDAGVDAATAAAPVENAPPSAAAPPAPPPVGHAAPAQPQPGPGAATAPQQPEPGAATAPQQPEPGAATAPQQLDQPGQPGQPVNEAEPIEVLFADDATTSAAADDESSAAAAEGDMVVTAQRYEQDQQKTPVTVTAFGQRSLDRRGITNLQDVSKFTPSLELHITNRPAGGGSAYAAYIRGIGTGDFQFPTDPGVGLYIDDVYIARTVGGLLSTDADLARIEVIKGPQGTLFGRNTIGGAFNVATSTPLLSGPATGSGLVRVGTYGRHDFAINVNAPLVDDAVGGKLSLSSQHSDGYGKRLLDGQRTNSEERFIARGGLLFKLSDRLDIRIDADYGRQFQNPPTGQFLSFTPAGPTLDKIAKFNQFAAPTLNNGLQLPADSVYDERWVSPSRFDNYALQPIHDRYTMGGGSAKITYRPTDWLQIKSISAARTLSSSISVDGDQTPYSLQTTSTDLDDMQLSEELQFSGRVLDDRLDYMVGLYAFRESGNSTVDTQSFHGIFENEPMPAAADAGDTLTRFKLTATSLAAFTQETLALLKGLNVTLGARINHDQKDYNYGVESPQLGTARVPPSQASAGWTSFTPKVGVDYSPVEPVMLYGSISQGFKSGGFGPSNNPDNPTPRYNPERVTAYELGIKSHWFEGRRLLANLAFFYNDYRDIQLTVQSRDPVTGANLRTTENAGRSHIKGFEADMVAKPFKGMALNAGVGYVDAKFSSLTADALTSGFQIGDRLPQIPDWSVNAGLQYTIDVAIGELTLRGDLSWKGDQYLTAVDKTSYQAAYAIYSARAAFVPAALDALELSIYGINLSDTVYYVYRATLPPTGQQIGLAGPPRLIFAMARYSF